MTTRKKNLTTKDTYDFNGDMPRPRFPYLQRTKTRHGKVVWYVRIGKGARTRIRGPYGSPEFIEQYHHAINGVQLNNPPDNKHSLKWLITQYKKSGQWELAASSTKKQRESFFSQMLDNSADVPYSIINKTHIMQGMDDRKNTPAAANNFLKTCKALFKWAYDADYIKTDPSRDIKKFTYRSTGHEAWQHEDVIAFQERWPIGTRERLAMELLLWTGLRRGDVVRFGRQHIKDGVGRLPAEKTGVDSYIAMPTHLLSVIEQSPTGDMAFIVTCNGTPRTKEAFGNWFRKACRKAGVNKPAHGLRKTAATLLAEAGATGRELMATFGWKSEKMATFYTLEADRKKLSQMASQKRLNVQQ